MRHCSGYKISFGFNIAKLLTVSCSNLIATELAALTFGGKNSINFANSAKAYQSEPVTGTPAI